MPTQDYIKHAYENEDVSVTEIACRTGVCWRTAEKYAKRDDWNQKKGKRSRSRVMDPVSEIVDTWLLEDRRLPRKHRRNAAAIFRQLKKEGFAGSERTVRSYVSSRRAELFREELAAFVELEQVAGDAQVDFGTAKAVDGDKLVDVQVLVVSFPFSNAGFAYPLPAQNQECFLEGLKRIFEQIGGTPKRLRFDNLSAAVVHIGRGEEREITDMFRRFKLQYRFEAEFCNASRGNEKGHVENKVGYTRRQWLSSLQSLDSFEELAENLQQSAMEDMQRVHYRKGTMISSLWETDHNSLLSLPSVPFEVTQLDTARLNKYCQFRWEKATYDVPQGQPETKVLLGVFWDRLEVRDAQGNLLTTHPRQYMRKEQTIDWAAYFEIYARRPRAAVHAALFPHLPEKVQEYLKQADSELRSKRVRLVRDMLRSYEMNAVAAALASMPADRRDDRAFLEHKLYCLNPKNDLPEPLTEAHTPPEVANYEPNSAVYDRLTPTQTKGCA